jgi:WD repeat-containing protein 23
MDRRIFLSRLMMSHAERSLVFEDDVDDYSCHSSESIPPSALNKVSLSQLLEARLTSGRTAQSFDSSVTSHFIPNTYTETSVNFDSRAYNGQFSPDGSLYYCSSQNEIKVFDTSDVFDWELQQEIICRNIHWTVTDIDLSPCKQFMLYSTMDNRISLVNLNMEADFDNKYSVYCDGNRRVHEQFDLSDGYDHFGICSVRFSQDGREVVAGTSRHSLEVYDLTTRTKVNSVSNAHSDDVNVVCFANRDVSNVIYTASDDSTIKVWDRRTLSSSKAPEGVLIGHREGITYLNSKGDGLQLISNCKDQTLKLWDIRRMKNYENYRQFRRTHRYQTGFDYRWQPYPLANYHKRLAEDCSLLTFRGHEVLQTLIRCYYSPLHSTGQRFIYTGSSDGRVVIYDTLTGNRVANLEAQEHDDLQESAARDVSWHPYVPAIAATSFLGKVGLYIHYS